MYNRLPGSVETVDNIALIQCFYGTDIARIRATIQALEFNLQMNKLPSTWVFVECQRKKSDAAFQWTRKYGLEYVFVPMKADNEGIMLKNPLWNIGAESCDESRLCFVDSDVVMCNSDWVEKAANAFANHDVLSLASHQYYQADEKCKIYQTIGSKWIASGSVEKGHVGFTIGLTRQALKEIGYLDPAIILDDIHTYHKIIGDDTFKPFLKWTKPFVLPVDGRFGHNLELGYADNIACHVWHGEENAKYDNLTKLLVASGIKSIHDILECPDVGELPRWKSGPAKCAALKKTILKYYSYLKTYELEDEKPVFDIVDEFHSEMKKALGSPDEKHPLFVCTVVKNRFGLKLDDFIEFRNRVENKFIGAKTQPVVLFFTDCKKYDFQENEINAVQLKDYDFNDEAAQCLRDDLKYPDNAVIYYVPFELKDFNSDIWIPDEKVENSDGTVLMSKPN